MTDPDRLDDAEGTRVARGAPAGADANLPGNARAPGLPLHALEWMSDAFVWLDRDWRYVFVNERAAAMSRRRPQELIGRNIWTESPESVGQAFHIACERAMAEQKPERIEVYFAPEARWFENRIYPSPDGLFIFFQDITERKQLEIANRAADSTLRSLVEQSLTGVYVIQNGRFAYVNPRLAEIFGFDDPRDMLALESIESLVHPDDRWRVRENLRLRLHNEAGALHYTFGALRRDGRQIDVEVYGSVGEYDGRPAIIGSLLDSTERVRNEEELRLTAERLRLLIAQLPATLWTADRSLVMTSVDGSRVSAGDATVALPLIGRPVRDAIVAASPAEVEVALEAHRRALAGESVGYEITQNGLTFDATVEPLCGVDGEIEGVVGVAIDVSDRQHVRKMLRAGEERFRALIEQATDLITIIDSEGRVRYASPSVERVLGISTQALVGTIALDLLHPDDLAVGQAYLSQITKLPFLRLATPLRFRHADGSWHHLAIVLTNMVENPAVRGIVVNARDVTEQLALETQLRQSQKMEALGQLAGGVAHDFNNVLAAISGFARLIHDDLPIGSEARDDASEILAAAARGAGVTKQLLAFSRRQAMETQVIDLADVARETHRMLRPFLPAAVSLDVHAPDSRVPVRADRTQLEQVLINLALNACDAMPAGGVLTVHVGVQRDSDGPHAREVAQLIVRDGGVGMSDEVRARVFEPFFTTKESGRGTGLGLATVYGIVRQFGGSVTVESEEGAGSTFTVELPLAHDTPSVIHAPSDHAVPPSEGRTILLVEDEEQVRRSTTRILERAGYHVVTAENGARALRLLTAPSTAIHLVLTDAAMPELGGRELAQRVAELRPDVPVVLMSGYAELSGQDLRISGVDDAPEVAAFLEKPFSAERLLSLVEPLLAR